MRSEECAGGEHDVCGWCKCSCHVPVLDDDDMHGLAGLGAGLLVAGALLAFVLIVGVCAWLAVVS